MNSITRRKFLKIAGLMGGSSLFAGCHFFADHGPVPKYINGAPGTDPVETLIGVETRYTVCGLCPGNCGIGCRVAEGGVVKIGGNPFHPSGRDDYLPQEALLKDAVTTGGSVCPIGGSGIQTLYDPFRIARPLKRVGVRGSNKWEPVSWEQALSEIVTGGDLFGEGIVTGLTKIKDSETGLAVIAGSADWSAVLFLKRFAAAFPGAVFGRDREASMADRARNASEAVFGKGTGIAVPDYRAAECVIGFGDAPLDSGVPLVSLAREIATARTESGGFKWAVADPRLSVSASKADVWLPVMPGADVFLALGILRALNDKDSAVHDPGGGGLLKAASERTVDEWAERCGVRADDIRAAAHMLASAGPKAAVFPGTGILAQSDGLEQAKAILALNLAVGSRPGTGGLYAKSDDFTDPTEQQLIDGTVDVAESYHEPAAALLTWRADPVYEDGDKAREFFTDRDRLPLFVAVDTHITETSAFSDYILPDTTYLERWDVCLLPPALKARGIGLRVPVVGNMDFGTGQYFPILPETRPMEDIVGALAVRLKLTGFADETGKKAKPAASVFDDMFRMTLNVMKETGFPVSGSGLDPAFIMERGGVFFPLPEQEEADGKQKPSRLIEISSDSTDEERPAEAEFRLITYALPFHRSPRSGLNSWLLEILPENRMMINASDARRLSIQERQEIVLESPDGNTKFRARAQIVPGIRPGVLATVRGFGYSQAGATAQLIGKETTTADAARSAGFNPADMTRVRIRKG
jgi:tetrathionate reductase subunit A